MTRLIVIFVGLLTAAVGTAHGLDAGTIGPTYEIGEPNLLSFIRQRLNEMERQGELRRLQSEARTRIVEAVRRPAPVGSIHATETARTYYVDPSFTLDRNIADAQGRLLFPAGTRSNPLQVVSLSQHLLFFDGRDPRQVRRASELRQRYAGRVKPILTGGSYFELMKAWHTPVYFDQAGVLTRRLGIRQVPALVSQEGLRLRVDELALP